MTHFCAKCLVVFKAEHMHTCIIIYPVADTISGSYRYVLSGYCCMGLTIVAHLSGLKYYYSDM